MLRQALQQSQQAATPSFSQPSTSNSSPSSNTTRNFASQLQQMRDLGITEEAIALQALEATNGDVQAAVNLIFSDFNN